MYVINISFILCIRYLVTFCRLANKCFTPISNQCSDMHSTGDKI